MRALMPQPRFDHSVVTTTLLSLLILSGCAVPGQPTHAMDTPSTLRLRPTVGSTQGLLFALDVPDGYPDSALLVLFRDDAEIARFAVSELGELPREMYFGDPTVQPGRSHVYECRVGLEEVLLDRVALEVRTSEAPARPPTPRLTAVDAGLRIDWRVPEGVWIQVFRRDVLNGEEAAPVSPLTQAGTWLDISVSAGGVYAYSLQASTFIDNVPWQSAVGAEGYVEITDAVGDRATGQHESLSSGR